MLGRQVGKTSGVGGQEGQNQEQCWPNRSAGRGWPCRAPPPHLRPSFTWQLRVWGQLKTSQSFLITCNGKRPFVSGFL